MGEQEVAFTEETQSDSHKHKWVLTAKTYAPPVRPIQQITDTKLSQIALFGLTTCILQCETCGELNKEEMLGSDENRWETIVDNVEKFGMQYIKENGEVYGVAKWAPQLKELEPTK